jgi:hypothetical protein
VWRYAWGDGVNFCCAARHAAERLNDHIFARYVHVNYVKTRILEVLEEKDATHQHRAGWQAGRQITNFFCLAQERILLNPPVV